MQDLIGSRQVKPSIETNSPRNRPRSNHHRYRSADQTNHSFSSILIRRTIIIFQSGHLSSSIILHFDIFVCILYVAVVRCVRVGAACVRYVRACENQFLVRTDQDPSECQNLRTSIRGFPRWQFRTGRYADVHNHPPCLPCSQRHAHIPGYSGRPRAAQRGCPRLRAALAHRARSALWLAGPPVDAFPQIIT